MQNLLLQSIFIKRKENGWLSEAKQTVLEFRLPAFSPRDRNHFTEAAAQVRNGQTSFLGLVLDSRVWRQGMFDNVVQRKEKTMQQKLYDAWGMMQVSAIF